MVKYLPVLINLEQMPTPLIQSRVCLFFDFYIDQLFTTQPRQIQTEYFGKILEFLILSLSLPKDRKIVSLQALDALSTQIGEDSLAQQVQENFDFVLKQLSQYNLTINLQSYFDFLSEFIRTHYHNFTQDNLTLFMQSLVGRIQKEINNSGEGGAKKKKTLSLKGGKGKIS